MGKEIKGDCMIVCPDENLQNVVLQHKKGAKTAKFEGRKKRIKDLTGIHNVSDSIYFFLSFNLIEDLSPLSKMNFIKELRLDSNSIRDITPLRNLVNLEYLNILKNFIDFSKKTERGILNLETMKILLSSGCKISYWKQKNDIQSEKIPTIKKVKISD